MILVSAYRFLYGQYSFINQFYCGSSHSLSKVYTKSLQKVYEREIGAFLDAVKLRVGTKDSKHGAAMTIKHSAGSSESLQSIDPRKQSVAKQYRQAFDKV